MKTLHEFLAPLIHANINETIKDILSGMKKRLGQTQWDKDLATPLSDESVYWFAAQMVTEVAHIASAEKGKFTDRQVEVVRQFIRELRRLGTISSVTVDEEMFEELINSVDAYAIGGLFPLEEGLKILGIESKKTL